MEHYAFVEQHRGKWQVEHFKINPDFKVTLEGWAVRDTVQEAFDWLQQDGVGPKAKVINKNFYDKLYMNYYNRYKGN